MQTENGNDLTDEHVMGLILDAFAASTCDLFLHTLIDCPSKRAVKSLKIRESGKFLRIFYVNQNYAEHLFINILFCNINTFLIVITELCKFVAYKTHIKVTVLGKLKITDFFPFH